MDSLIYIIKNGPVLIIDNIGLDVNITRDLLGYDDSLVISGKILQDDDLLCKINILDIINPLLFVMVDKDGKMYFDKFCNKITKEYMAKILPYWPKKPQNLQVIKFIEENIESIDVIEILE